MLQAKEALEHLKHELVAAYADREAVQEDDQARLRRTQARARRW